ncbi:hypothetical protein [Clostridium rectalis]|uniref:hypothetical protein n=1 Tax=Clostridium rectalis TaxID=2040295 RepID=UPI0013DE1FB5|nr:hypothetical protein [Clostridium rectalis]
MNVSNLKVKITKIVSDMWTEENFYKRSILFEQYIALNSILIKKMCSAQNRIKILKRD